MHRNAQRRRLREQQETTLGVFTEFSAVPFSFPFARRVARRAVETDRQTVGRADAYAYGENAAG